MGKILNHLAFLGYFLFHVVVLYFWAQIQLSVITFGPFVLTMFLMVLVFVYVEEDKLVIPQNRTYLLLYFTFIMLFLSKVIRQADLLVCLLYICLFIVIIVFDIGSVVYSIVVEFEVVFLLIYWLDPCQVILESLSTDGVTEIRIETRMGKLKLIRQAWFPIRHITIRRFIHYIQLIVIQCRLLIRCYGMW